MQCCNPKILPVVGPDNTLTFQFQRCGDCYACKCGRRGEMVLRCEREYKDSYNVCKFFFTLTYDDNHITAVVPDWPRVSWYYHNQPEAYRHYDFCLLEPSHLSKFIEDLSNEFKILYCGGHYNNHGDVVGCELNNHLRYFCTGEYGDISHRPHYHGVLFTPRFVSEDDFCSLLDRSWPHGGTSFESISSNGASNYVAKHQVKECEGSLFQQKASPIFARYSVYEGGIGRIMKKDSHMRDLYYNFLVTRDRKDLCYHTYQDHRMFNISIPRFLIKDWHPERFSDEQLVISQKEGLLNLQKFIFDNLTDNMYLSGEFRDALQFVSFQLENFNQDEQYSSCQDVDLQNYEDLERMNYLKGVVAQPLIDEDKQRRKVYINSHISKKLKLLSHGSPEEKNIIY